MTGLLGGGHAIYFDARLGRARLLDCFAPSRRVRARRCARAGRAVRRGARPLRGRRRVVRGAGRPGGARRALAAYGRLPWARLCEPALRLAREGVPMPPAHVACLEMLEPVMTMREGARDLRAGGRAARGRATSSSSRGSSRALELLRDEGAASSTGGRSRTRSSRSSRSATARHPARDLEVRGALGGAGRGRRYAGRRFVDSRGLSAASPDRRLPVRPVPEPERTSRSSTLLDAANRAEATRRTSRGRRRRVRMRADDEPRSRLRRLAPWARPAPEQHARRDRPRPRRRSGPASAWQSMMAPTLVFDDDGLELALGAAGGTRLRTALVGVPRGTSTRGSTPQAAIDRPRFHPAGSVVNAEPGVDETFLAAARGVGRIVRRWPSLHHYFGGVSAVGAAGAGARPPAQRSGVVS